MKEGDRRPVILRVRETLKGFAAALAFPYCLLGFRTADFEIRREPKQQKKGQRFAGTARKMCWHDPRNFLDDAYCCRHLAENACY